MECPSCHAPLVASAKFCPRCGRGISPEDLIPHGVVPAHAPLPLAGRLMFGALGLAPILIGLGVYLHLPWLWIVGIAIGTIVIVILAVGSHVC